MEKWVGARPKVLVAVVAVSVFAAGCPVLLGQAVRRVPRVRGPVAAVAEPVDEDIGPANFASPDRNVLQALNRAQKVLKEHRYGEGLEVLTQILRSSNDDFFFQPDPKVPIYKSLKTEAQQLLGQMPREGRDLYEVRSGAEARDKLNKAVADGDDAALSQISAQLFHTQAGYEATYLHALYQMDHGAPLAAALTLKRLREAPAAEGFEPGLSLTQAACYYQAGMPGECQQILVELKRRLARPTFLLAGREMPWFEQEADAPAWLAKLTGLKRMAAAAETDQWAMFRGDPSRNAVTVGSPPLLNLRWRIDVSQDDSLQKALVEQEAFCRDHNLAVFSGLHPLAIDDKVFMRTTTNVLAIDFRTGKRLWPMAEEDKPEEPVNRVNPGFYVQNNMTQQAKYGQRIWDDATYGTLSSDGRLLFVIEELPLGVGGPNNQFMVFGGGRGDATNHGVSNKLVAYEIQSKQGKREWELGGNESLELSGVFFLGPPLPLRGQLYVMAEVSNELRLYALDAATGAVIWKQQLSQVDGNITNDPVRRLAGVSPSYSDGVLVCPTGSGCAVAVDLATHSLLWGYIYNHPGEMVAGGRRMRGGNPIQNAFYNPNGPVPRWLDGTAVIANGRVLLTPAEADGLYCLNLADGKLAWGPKPRVEPPGPHGEQIEHFYIACVYKGAVVLVGRNTIDAVNLSDGNKAWDGRTIDMPAGVSVCGHGCYAGGQYFVPLSSGDVATVDLDTGKIIGTAKSRRNGVPGNLICYRGRVISQGLDGLELYYQVDAAREECARLLAANADDVEGLTLHGEIALDAGKSTEAVADFRRAYSLDKKSESHGRTRELLRDALLAGLRDDFPAHRSLAGEVEPLLDDPAQRVTYLRYMAAGLQHAGDWRQAVECYLKLVDMEEVKPALEKMDRTYLVRRDRWVQAQLGMLRSEGGGAAAAEIDRAVDQRLEKARQDKGLDGLRQFLAFFGSQPQAGAARTELINRLTQAGRIIEAELLIAGTVDSADRKSQAATLADMAELEFRTGRVSDAAACFRLLQREFADVPCRTGMTASQWLAGFPGGDALRKEVNPQAPAWHVGEVNVSQADGNENPIAGGFRYDLLMGGPRGPFFTDYTVCLENNQQRITLRDGLGHLKPQAISLVENGRMFGGYYNPNSSLARNCGHLLIASVGTRILALDPWPVAGDKPQILWSHDLTETGTDNFGNVFINRGFGQDFRPNPFGPVNARYVSFVRRRSIVAADPLTGESLWVRQEIPQGCEVFGDEQYLLVLPPGGDEAQVYRGTDGQLLGTRKVPRPKNEVNARYINYGGYGLYQYGGNAALANAGIEFLGRYVLTWQQGADNNGRVLSLFDPWQQKAVWPSRTFASGACVSMVGNEAVGVLEPSGHFVLVALADGHSIADLQLELRPHVPMLELIVARLGDQYIVLAHDNRVLGNGGEDQLQPLQGMSCCPIRRARVYALDLQGKLAWPAPVDIDHQQFLLGQPGRLPALIFAGFHNQFRNNGQNDVRTSLVAVDRRNGRIVYDKDIRGPMKWMGVDIRGDVAENSMRVVAYNGAINLKFTDKPIQTTVRRSAGVKKPSGKLGEALLDAVEGALPPLDAVKDAAGLSQ